MTTVFCHRFFYIDHCNGCVLNNSRLVVSESIQRVSKILGKDIPFYAVDILDKENLNTIFKKVCKNTHAHTYTLTHIYIYVCIYICFIIRDNVTYEGFRVLVVLLSFYWIKVSQLRFICVLYIYMYMHVFDALTHIYIYVCVCVCASRTCTNVSQHIYICK